MVFNQAVFLSEELNYRINLS